MAGANGHASGAEVEVARWRVTDQKTVEGMGLFVTFDTVLPASLAGGFVGLRVVGGPRFENFTAVSTVGEKVVILVPPLRRTHKALREAFMTAGAQVEARGAVLGLHTEVEHQHNAVYYAYNAGHTLLAVTPLPALLRWNVAGTAVVQQPKVIWAVHSAEEVDYVAKILKHLPRDASRPVEYGPGQCPPLLWVVMSGRHGKFADIEASIQDLKAALLGENPPKERAAALEANVRVFAEPEGADRVPDYVCAMMEVTGDTNVVVEPVSSLEYGVAMRERLAGWFRKPEHVVDACARVDLGSSADVDAIKSAVYVPKDIRRTRPPTPAMPYTKDDWSRRSLAVATGRVFGYAPEEKNAWVDYEPWPLTSWLPPFSFSPIPFGRSTLGIQDWMFLPTDPLPLALFRIAFGYLCADYAKECLYHGRAYRDHVTADMRFKYDYFEFLGPDLPETYMWAMYYLMFFSGIGMMLGWPYRLSCFGFGFSFMWHFFVEATHYNNHYYLMWMVGYIFMIIRADACLKFSPWRTLKYVAGSLFNAVFRRAPKDDPEKRQAAGREVATVTPIPYFHHFLLRGLVLFVFWYGFVAKCNNDWNSGHVMRAGMTGDQPPWIVVEFAVFFLAWGGTVYDMIGPLFLIHSPLRVPALLGFTFFNVSNMLMFNIGCFPWMMLGSMTLLCETQTMRIRLRGALRWCATQKGASWGRLPRVEGAVRGVLRWVGRTLFPVFPSYTDGVYQLRHHETYYSQPMGILKPPAPKPMRSYPKFYRVLLVTILWIVCIFHSVYPLRNWAYHYGTDQTVAWTEHGRKMSWHMMSRHKACDGNYTVVNEALKFRVNYTMDTIRPEMYNGPVHINNHQRKKLGHIATYMRQLAVKMRKYHEDRAVRLGHDTAARIRIDTADTPDELTNPYTAFHVYVDVWCSVNGQPRQPFVDERTELSRAQPPKTPGEREPWIVDQTDFSTGYPDLYPYKTHKWTILEGVNPMVAEYVAQLRVAMYDVSLRTHELTQQYYAQVLALAEEHRPAAVLFVENMQELYRQQVAAAAGEGEL